MAKKTASKGAVAGMCERDLKDEELQIRLRSVLTAMMARFNVAAIDVADGIDRSLKTVNGWLSGTKRLKFKHLEAVANHFGGHVALTYTTDEAKPSVES